jgi:hypothetical protein
MQANNSTSKDQYAEALDFFKTSTKRHINMEDLNGLVYLIYESQFGNELKGGKHRKRKQKHCPHKSRQIIEWGKVRKKSAEMP